MRREDPARVVPLALATLCAIAARLGGLECSAEDFLEDWGAISADEAAEIDAMRSLANFRAIAERRKNNAQ